MVEHTHTISEAGRTAKFQSLSWGTRHLVASVYQNAKKKHIPNPQKSVVFEIDRAFLKTSHLRHVATTIMQHSGEKNLFLKNNHCTQHNSSEKI